MVQGAGKSIIFCATQRTGSGLVFDDFRNLAGHPPSGSEILYRIIIRDNAQKPWPEVWEEARKITKSGGYFADKVMFHYVPKLSKFMSGGTIGEARNGTTFAAEEFDAFHTFFRDAIWVHIRRNDAFAQAVSLYLAEITDVWYRWRDRQAPPPTPPDIPYDFTKIKHRFRALINEAEQWHRFFDHYHIQPISIEYDDAVERYPEYLSPLFEKLQLPMVEPPPERRIMKTGDTVNEKFTARFKSDILIELYKSSDKDL